MISTRGEWPTLEEDDDSSRFYATLERMYKREQTTLPTYGLELEEQMSNNTETKPNSITTPATTPQVHVVGSNKHAVHMKLKIKGSAEKIMFFHWLMTELDPDWPYSAKRRNPHLPVFCPDCKGYIYRDPEYSPEEIKLIASQISENKRLHGSFQVKVKMYTRLPECADVATIAEAQSSMEDEQEKLKGLN